MEFTGKIDWILKPKAEKVWLIKQDIVVSDDLNRIPFRLIRMGKQDNLDLGKDLKKGDFIKVDYTINAIQKGGDFWPKIIVNNIEVLTNAST